MDSCTHLDAAAGPPPPMTTPGCVDCLAIGQVWVHLRQCLVCGRIGCCNDSIGKHATAHFHTVGHPTIRSAEPDDGWRWCFVDEVVIDE